MLRKRNWSTEGNWPDPWATSTCFTHIPGSKRVHALFTSRVFVFLQPSCNSDWFFIWPVPDSRAGMLDMCQNPSLPREELQAWDIPLSTVFPARGVCLNLVTSLLFLLHSVWIFLHSLGCRSIFPPSLQFVSMRVASHIDVSILLMCSWGKVNSTSSYSTTLTLSPFFSVC